VNRRVGRTRSDLGVIDAEKPVERHIRAMLAGGDRGIWGARSGARPEADTAEDPDIHSAVDCVFDARE
jgi:hypothetical protein